MFYSSIKNNHGFSLIELSVVLGIAATVALIAIPNFQGYRARALRKEGFGLLNSYYATAQNAFIEFGSYPGNLVETGFAPEGQIGYRLYAGDVAGTVLPWTDANCTQTDRDCDCGGNCPLFKTWQELPDAGANAAIGPMVLGAGACVGLPAVGATATTFSIRVSGSILIGAGADVHGMDQTKNLVTCSDGIN